MSCIGCGVVQTGLTGALRCPQCGDLLEITFPGWKAGGVAGFGLRSLKLYGGSGVASPSEIDQSGVWRFREVLPAFAGHLPITLREGCTPLYELPNCARAAGSSIFTQNIKE